MSEMEAARSVTRRLLDDWIPDMDRRGWWHVGSGMEGDGQLMTDDEHAWLISFDP